MNKFIEKAEMSFAALLILAFFLPWISMGGLITFSGYNIPEAIKGISDIVGIFAEEEVGTPGTVYLAYLLYLIPLLGLTVIILGFKDIEKKIVTILAGALPYIYLIYALIKVGNIFESASIGLYLTLIAGLCLILSAFGIIKFNKKAESLVPEEWNKTG